MKDVGPVVVGTGHRPDKLGGYADCPLHTWCKRQIVSKLVRMKPGLVYTGMAVGFDQWLAQICVQYDIPFIAAVPFEGQEKIWPTEARVQYHWLLKHAKEVRTISPPGYDPHKMQLRNEWMVDQMKKPEDRLLCLWDGTPGGTSNCVHYAERRKKKIIRINPAKSGLLNYGRGYLEVGDDWPRNKTPVDEIPF